MATIPSTATSTASVLIPLLKRVMPAILARNIIGVQPMVGPSGSVFALRGRYQGDLTRPKISPRTYHHFLRLNNRRRTQNSQDLLDAGYDCHGLKDLDFIRDYHTFEKVDAWCDRQLGPHAWLRFRWTHQWWFSRSQDAVLFRMTWG